MRVKFFGQFLIDTGEIDAGHLREALQLMDRENPSIGEIAYDKGMMQADEVRRVHAEQRRRDVAFGDLAVEMGLLEPEQLVEILQRQCSRRLPIGQALVRLGHLESDQLGLLLDAYKTDQAGFDAGVLALPDGLVGHRVARHIIDLLPRFLLRVARIQAKVGEIHTLQQIPEFAKFRVSVPIQGARGLEVAIVSDREFAEALAVATSGFAQIEFDDELVADGVGEFLNVLCGNAASIVAKSGHSMELGPPDYAAEVCDGWLVDVAVGTGRAALVLSTY